MNIQTVVDEYTKEQQFNNDFRQRINRLYDGYPSNPPFIPEEYENIIWYYNKKENWGCWIQREAKGPMLVPRSLDQAIFLPVKEDSTYPKIYKSPVPLHSAEVPNSFRAHMAWCVDEKGWGQYVFLSRSFDPTLGRFVTRHVLITKGD